MKPIHTLREAPRGLSAYIVLEPEDASWDGFRSHEAGKAYRELRCTLINLQHGLCGYCEAQLGERDLVQVEHVHPRRGSDIGRRRELDQINMMVCCLGGTKEVDCPEQYLLPVKDNISCGQAKGGMSDARFVDPRTLPALPALVRVRDTGEIEADPDACEATDIRDADVDFTIKTLGLDVRRLQQARQTRWRALLNGMFKDGLDDPDLIIEAARQELIPAEDGRLPAFFTTARSFFGPVAETVLAEHPQTWI